MSSINLYCAVPGCSGSVSLTSPIVKWFPFPDRNSLTSFNKNGKTMYNSKRKLWLESLGLTDKGLDRNAVVCPLHFKEKDFTVGEGGKIILRDDAVPFRCPDSRQVDVEKALGIKQNVNVIETIEKSDDEDDDIEIIEPHREIITLDDDEDEECPQVTPTPEHVSSKCNDKEQNSVDNSADLNNTKKAEENSKTSSTTNSETSKPIRQIINRRFPKKKVTGLAIIPVKNGAVDIANINRASIVKNTELKEPDIQCVQKDGNYIVQMPQTTKQTPTPAARGKTKDTSTLKFINIPEIKKMIIPKVSAHIEKLETALANAQKMREQGKNITPDKGKGSTPAEVVPKTQGRMVHLLQFHDEPAPIHIPKDTIDRILSYPLMTSLRSSQAPFLLQALSKTDRVQTAKNGDTSVKTPKKPANQDSVSTFINVDDPANDPKDKEKPKEDVKTTREFGTQTEDPPIGIYEMYDFIQKNLIDFSIHGLEQNYTLKECALHFVTRNNKTLNDKHVAVIGKATLSSTDSCLLNGMNVSIGLGKKKQFQLDGHARRVFRKAEVLLAPPDPSTTSPGTSSSNINNQTRPLRKETKKIDYGYTEIKKDKKIIISPNMVLKRTPNKNDQAENVTSKVSIDNNVTKTNTKPTANQRTKTTDKGSMLGKKKFAMKKKVVSKTSLARSRKVMQLPMSQMNPTSGGRLNVDRNRVKAKRVIHSNEKKKKQLENGNIGEPKMDESKASTSTDMDSICESAELNLSSEGNDVRRTRSTTRGNKRDYRRLSEKGTTEYFIKWPAKRKKSTDMPLPKKAKYSDKVGAIESFLEVVLQPEPEPEHGEFDQSINESKSSEE